MNTDHKFKNLKIGKKIKFISIPSEDLKEFQETNDDFTVRIFQKLIDNAHTITISEIDEYGYPWFDYNFTNESGEKEHHSLAVMNDEGWVLI